MRVECPKGHECHSSVERKLAPGSKVLRVVWSCPVCKTSTYVYPSCRHCGARTTTGEQHQVWCPIGGEA